MSQFVFVDESGITTEMTRRYGRAVHGVRERIEQTGASLCCLPPYSPDFNPIEKCWAQMKQKLRSLKARSVTTLEQALGEALAALTAQNAADCFRHAGFSMIIMKLL